MEEIRDRDNARVTCWGHFTNIWAGAYSILIISISIGRNSSWHLHTYIQHTRLKQTQLVVLF